MESVIIEEMRAFLRLDLPDRQRQYFTDTIAAAKRVEVVKAADVFDEREIELIRRTVRPVVKECYKNAHLLTLLFPDRVQYVEGKTNVLYQSTTHLTGSGTNILTLRLSSHWG